MDFDTLCDALCFAPDMWPADMRHLYRRMTKLVKRCYGRWDLCHEEVCKDAIEFWKQFGTAASDEELFDFIAARRGPATKTRGKQFAWDN